MVMTKMTLTELYMENCMRSPAYDKNFASGGLNILEKNTTTIY